MWRSYRNRLEILLENSAPNVSREDSAKHVTAARGIPRLGLARRQAADMNAFWGKYVKEDRHLLSTICRDFRHYTVEGLIWIPNDFPELIQKEVAWDSHISSLRGFDAWSVLNPARMEARGEDFSCSGTGCN